MSTITILIVEDEAITAMGLKKSLTDMGYSVCGVAPTGELAVQKAGELQPDLILMDIQLAGKMDGIEAAEQIRDKYHTPLIILTAFSDDKYIESAKVTEPFGYLLKPVREHELRTTIEMALYKNKIENELRLSEETARILLNETDDIHYLMDADGKFILANKALAIKTEKSVAELKGVRVKDMVTAGHFSPAMACWKITPLQKESVHIEDEFGGKWYDIGIFPISADSNVVRYSVHIHEITKIKMLEEQLRQNDEFFRSFIENTSDLIVILNRDGTIRFESPTLIRMLRFAQGSVIGKNFFDLIHDDSLVAAKQVFADVTKVPYAVKPFQLKFRSKEGVAMSMDGIISNQYNNVVMQGIVLTAWVRRLQS